ncbi:fimbria/pilus outer membrane usher protein [Aeromonas bivalvium]|uniref:fimbria/pilus outer membrane usher protein n=2 Tax=Aeromonas bivalvium TaxID=440079 RepID=UPI0038D1EB4A
MAIVILVVEGGIFMNRRYKSKISWTTAVLVVLYAHAAAAENNKLEFDTRFIMADGKGGVADLAQLMSVADTPPGKYNVDLYVNKKLQGAEVIEFVDGPAELGLIPCFSREKWLSLGLNEHVLVSMLDSTTAGENCLSNEALLTLIDISIDLEKAKLEIGIPQAYMDRQITGYVDPDLWDNGITSATINYNLNGTHDEQGNSLYTYLNSGVNIGPWRFRNTSTWNYYDEFDANEWKAITTYAERSIQDLASNIKIGQTYSQDPLFQSESIRGIQLSTDQGMLPDSLRGFAPSIHGIAKSYAEVWIIQNENIVYRTFVAPGPFVIEDIYPTASSGDLEVTIKESDGSFSRFTQPYSSLPVMQREGSIKYEFNMGAQEKIADSPYLLQGSLAWGLSTNTTLYGGSQLTDYYQALALGVGKNLGDIGAVSMDVTHAMTKDNRGESYKGNSVRFLYAKSLNDFGTNFNIFGYRYSTNGFLTLGEANSLRTWQMELDSTNNYGQYPAKGEVQATISQGVGQYSSIYISMSYKDYWGEDNVNSSNIYAGFNSNIQGISYGITYNSTESIHEVDRAHMLSLNFSMPLNMFTPLSQPTANPAYVNYMATTDLDGDIRHSASLSGSALDNNALSYSLTQGYAQKEHKKNGGAFASYKGAKAKAELGISYGQNSTRLNYGLSGGAIVHEDGVTLGPELGHTNILIKAPGAASAEIESAMGVKTDDEGFAIQSYAADFRENRVALRVDSLSTDVEVSEPVVQVVPTRGAVVRAEFKAAVGYRAVVTLLREQREPIPFGAMAKLQDGDSEGIVAERGILFLSGLPEAGVIDVRWGEQNHQRCRAEYRVEGQSAADLIMLRSLCR